MLPEHVDASTTPPLHPAPNPKIVFLSDPNTKIPANFPCKNYHTSRPECDALTKNGHVETHM